MTKCQNFEAEDLDQDHILNLLFLLEAEMRFQFLLPPVERELLCFLSGLGIPGQKGETFDQ